MQRLTRLQRERERGASAVIVALVMVVLLGFGAISVDLGALWSDRKQLQNGADAGALAIAQACAKDTKSSECVLGTNGTANGFAISNKIDGSATGTVTALNTTSSPFSVTVRTTSTRTGLFSGFVGSKNNLVSAQATASWSGTPSSMTTLPLAFSYCQFQWQNGSPSGPPTNNTVAVMWLKSKDKDWPVTTGTIPCTDSKGAHNEAGGGFGWLVSGSDCSTTLTALTWASSSPGASSPCTDAQLIAALVPGTTVKVPMFDQTNGLSGSNAKYRLTGFAALKVGGYCLSNKAENMPWLGKCNGDTREIWGDFQGYSELSTGTTGGSATDYGVKLIALTD